jgi:hypothetical protein
LAAGEKSEGWGLEHDKMLIILNNGHTPAKTRKITHHKFSQQIINTKCGIWNYLMLVKLFVTCVDTYFRE